MMPLTFKDVISLFGEDTHIIVEYWSSVYPVDTDIPFSNHCISSSTIDFHINDVAMEFPKWMLTSYVHFIVIDPDRAVRIYLYGIK